MKKTNELKNYNKAKLEKFYDIVIDINSVKRLNTDGWKVKFTKRGLNKYKQYKDKKLITIGVIGNNNKGKSFLLSKLSKIKLLTGTSIQTEGLSVKYPKLKGYKGRQIILLDSAGLETPVLRNEQDENEIKEEKKEEKEIKEEKRDENEIKDDLKDENEIKEEHNNNNDSKKNEEIQKIQNEEIKKQNNDKEIKQNKIFKENAIKREIQIMKKIENENSVKLYESFDLNDYHYLLLELCDGDLEKELEKRLKETNHSYNELEVYMIFTQLNNCFEKMVSGDEEVVHKKKKSVLY